MSNSTSFLCGLSRKPLSDSRKKEKRGKVCGFSIVDLLLGGVDPGAVGVRVLLFQTKDALFTVLQIGTRLLELSG